MQITLSNHTWVSLPNEVRHKIRVAFQIPRSSNTVVDDGKIITDGTTDEDLKHLTTEKMQTYLGDTSTDYHKLFDKVIAKVTEELYPTIVVTEGLEVAPTPKKRGRPSKK